MEGAIQVWRMALVSVSFVPGTFPVRFWPDLTLLPNLPPHFPTFSFSTLPDTSEARKVYNDVQRDLTSLESSVTSTRSTLDRLASGEYGPQAEWKKLENTCISKEQGDYTYELCWLGRATQRSNRDGASHHLGTFFGWNQDPTVDKSSEAYYGKQLYNRG